MTQTTFTPGPWELRGPTRVYGNLQRDQNWTGDLVATTVSAADANLIAAAPELYEALTLLLAPSDGHDNMNREFARRAIALARGEKANG